MPTTTFLMRKPLHQKDFAHATWLVLRKIFSQSIANISIESVREDIFHTRCGIETCV
ncbi:MAG: hypothetical protein KAI83_18130 [Thiomargarita sp.]|nr:hypothetical protein [Thiomargarita sp.]